MVGLPPNFAFAMVANAFGGEGGMTPWQSALKRTHKKGISDTITYSSFRDDDPDDESSKVDTWVGFYNPRKSARRSLGP